MFIGYRYNSVRRADGHHSAPQHPSEVPSAALVRYDVTICRADTGEEVLCCRDLKRASMHALREMFVAHDHGYVCHVSASEIEVSQ